MKIYKYELNHYLEATKIKLPACCKVLDIQIQDDKTAAWVSLNQNKDFMVEHIFIPIFTGRLFTDSDEYLKTIQYQNGIVVHWYLHIRL
jgi:hypothetical protein